MNNRMSKIMGRETYKELAAVGFASGTGNRARTFRTKKEKANDPKRQRKTWRNEQN